MNANKPRRISIGFACSYLILLIIPLIMGISTYSSSVQLSRSNVIAASETVLSQFGESIDNSLDAASQFALSISSSIQKSILSFSNKDSHSSEQIYAVRSAIDTLPIHMDSNGLTNNYFIIEYETDIVVSPRVGYLTSYSYYSSLLDTQKLDYSLWYDTISNTSNFRIQSLPQQDEDSLLLYAIPFSTLGSAKPSYSVVFTLDTQMLRNLMQPILESSNAEIYVLNGTQELLLSAGSQSVSASEDWFREADLSSNKSFEQKVDGQRMLVSIWKGDYFSLVSMVPHAVVTQRASDVLHTILLYLVLYVLAELLLCIWIMRRNQQPVSRMLDHLEGCGDGNRFRVGLSDLENAVKNLSANAHSLENSLREQKHLLRSAYINRLVSGDIIDESETEYHLEQVGFSIEGSIMRGIYMHWKTCLPPDQTLNLLRAQVIELLDRFNPDLQFISLTSAHRFALLYAAQEPEDDRHAELLRTLYSRLKLDMNIDVSFFVGHPCTRLKNVHESFSAAAVLMNNTSDEDERFLFEAEDSLPDGESNQNMMREEQKIGNLLAVGNIEAIDSLLNEMYREYFCSAQLDPFARKLFCYRLVGALVSANQEIPLPVELKYSIASLPAEQFFSLVRTHCQKLCALYQEKKQQQANELIQRIAEYIDLNFNNPDISLYSVAVEFGMTESYLSLFIKEKLGETFSARVERLRIEKANQLLRETDLRIDVISEQVGYANSNTFRRAYRRVQGFSPSDYRAEKSGDQENSH